MLIPKHSAALLRINSRRLNHHPRVISSTISPKVPLMQERESGSIAVAIGRPLRTNICDLLKYFSCAVERSCSCPWKLLRVYGSPRIHQELLRRGMRTSEPTVARLMRELGLRSKVSKRKKVTTRGLKSH